MGCKALVPVLKQVSSKIEDFDDASNSLAGLRAIDQCISAHVETVGEGAFRTVALFEIDNLDSDRLSGGQSIAYMHPEEIAFCKAGPALRANLRYVRDWLGEGDCDESFSDPIDKALDMVEPHMENKGLEPYA